MATTSQTRGRHRGALIAVIVVSVVVIVGVAVAAALVMGNRQREAAAQQAALDRARTPRAVTVAVSAAGLDDIGTAVPVSVSGTTALGEPVSQTCYVSAQGAGISVAAGTYELTVSASPIAADGTLYQLPADPLSLTVPEAGESEDAGAPLDLSADVALALAPIPATDVTDDQLKQALDAANAGGCSTPERAQELYQTAMARRDQAVQERDRAATAAQYHIVAPSYEFDLPEYWWGKVEVEQNGDEVFVYAAGNPDQGLCSLLVDNYDTCVAGDIANGVVWQWQLDDTRVLQLWTDRWTYLIGMEALGEPQYLSLTPEDAEKLIDLSTGGTATLDDVLAVANEQGVTAMAFPSTDWAESTLVPLVSPHTSDPGRSTMS